MRVLEVVSVLVIATTFVSSTQAQMRCGVPMPSKQEVERSTARLDTERFFDVIAQRLAGEYKGYAVIFTGAAGRRLGFRRAGWAVDPCDSGPQAAFTLNTESAIGSVTKLLTTVTVLKATNDHLRLQRPMTAFLPFRWRRLTHGYYDTVTIEKLLQHRGGFFKSAPKGSHVTDRLRGGRELSGRERRSYSNASMGIFHYIYAKYAFRAPYHQTEVAYQDAPLDQYSREIQDRSSHYFNLGLYRSVFGPLRISATCDARKARFPDGQSEYFRFHDVARSYGGPRDGRGRLLASSERNCAAGGVYMSAKDLAAFMSALDDTSFLSRRHRDRMINDGPADDLYAFFAAGDGRGGRVFWHNGGRNEGGDSSVAYVMRYPSGAHAVFVANSPFGPSGLQRAFIDAYDAARGR